jgi:hypothetical protein
MTTSALAESFGYRLAPPGFTPEQRAQFDREGFLHIPNALSEGEIEAYLEAIDRCIAQDPKFDAAKFYPREHMVEADPLFSALIDHPRHVGFAYDFFGELLKLHISQFFVRPRGGWHNPWHPDGARAVPYGVFSPVLPMQIKFALWLTDLPEPRMGNLVVMPGSQRTQVFPGYDTGDSYGGEHIVCARRGTMTIINGNIWHRVEPNESDMVRKNIFLAYCPSWVVAGDHLRSDPEWLETLNREQRIIMRDYDNAYDHTKPPARDFPLFLDRDSGLDHDPGVYPAHVAHSRRKRMLAHEKSAAQQSRA